MTAISVPLDRSRLQMAADTKEEEDELLALFFRGAEAKILVMQDAIAAQDWMAWRQAAHYLKGSSSNLGMHVLIECCRKAEQGEVISAQEATATLDAIKAEMQRIRDYLAASV